MIENGFIYAVNKSLQKEAKRKAREDKKAEKVYAILKKYNKTLDEITKSDLTKTEYKFLIEYIEKVLKYPLRFYPNLQ